MKFMKTTNQSPKYPLRWKDLSRVLSKNRLVQKWRKKTRVHTRIQFFPDIADFIDIHTNISFHADKIRKDIANGTYKTSEVERYRVEKSKGLCRLMVNPHPFDLLVLQCLSDTLYNQIKDGAPSKNAFFEPQDHSFSKFKNEEPEYDTKKSWQNFLEKILNFQQTSEVIVITDIANYYDFIDFGNLRNVISAQKKVNESIMDFLIYVLRGLSWQPDFMPFRSTGLPQINADAPRLLAHAYLFELDAFIESEQKQRYARFMDDIDAGVDNISEAKCLLRDIDLVLQSRNLRLNSGKTKILSKKSAMHHFRVRDNAAIDSISKFLEKDVNKGKSILKKLQRLSNCIDSMHKSKKFDEGNGEKVLKRLVGILTSYKFSISQAIFNEIILKRPNIRAIALKNASVSGFNNSHFESIISYFEKGLVCDDAFQMNVAESLVSANLTYDGTENSNLERVSNLFDTTTIAGSPSLLWLASRYFSHSRFLTLAEKLTQSRLSVYSYRLIGAHVVRVFSDHKKVHETRMLVQKLSNRDCESMFEFFFDLCDAKGIPKTMLDYARAKNKTFPQECTHAKFYSVAAIIHNKNTSQAEKNKLNLTHSKILNEKSYKNKGLI